MMKSLLKKNPLQTRIYSSSHWAWPQKGMTKTNMDIYGQADEAEASLQQFIALWS